ncbi:RING-type E3 ubiquitin transferase [Trifolium repens]|nr:RING-type E3 ubiquitin transferase [Trifolium repens]
MAVETPHINFFSPQLLINNRENNNNNNKPNQQHFYNIPMPMSSTMHPESFFPIHQSSFCEPKADSGVTYHNNIPDSRKRYRDFITNEESNTQKHYKLSSQSPILDQHLLHHFQNHQSETDRIIAQHTEKVRMELEEQRMKQSRMLLCAIQETVVKKLKEKDEEIHNIGKYNLVLQEKIKSLIMENQIWREMAITNETAVNTLRNELEQVLAHVNENHHHHNIAEDAESSCSSNHHHEVEEEGEETSVMVVGKMCNNCGVRESVVLLLPCRHLCLCTVCGTHIRNCPLCFSRINASVHVNFS